MEFNEQCKGLVEQPDEEIAYLGETVFLDRPNMRHANNALAQAVAASFQDAHGRAAPADLAVVNGGSFRAEGYCVTRSSLEEGPLTRGELHEILQFQNLVVAVDLTEPELVAMLEHSVERLNRTGEAVTSPPGAFLHLAGARMDVDCAASPRVQGAFIVDPSGGVRAINVAAPSSAVRYRVALTSFLLSGGDGYEMLVGPGKDPSRNPLQAESFGGREANIAAEYMRRTYPVEAPLRVDRERVRLTSCAEPPPPGG